jgi:hypothetical protein
MPVVSEVVEALSVEAQRAGVTLVIEGGTPGVCVPLPGDAASQILTNVLLNALAWAPRGSAGEHRDPGRRGGGHGLRAGRGPRRPGGAGAAHLRRRVEPRGRRRRRSCATRAPWPGRRGESWSSCPSSGRSASGEAPASGFAGRALEATAAARPPVRAAAGGARRHPRARRGGRRGRRGAARIGAGRARREGRRGADGGGADAAGDRETHDAALVDLSPIAARREGAPWTALRKGSPDRGARVHQRQRGRAARGAGQRGGQPIRWVRKPFEVA